MKIHVRRRHIVGSVAKDAGGCPIALAAREYTGSDVYVLYRHIHIGSDLLILPRSARRFIARFDAGKPVKPFAFVLK